MEYLKQFLKSIIFDFYIAAQLLSFHDTNLINIVNLNCQIFYFEPSFFLLLVSDLIFLPEQTSA